MKYVYQAFSLDKAIGVDTAVFLVRGAFFYKTASGFNKLLFPWNAHTICISLNDLPVVFWGFRGKEVKGIDNLVASAIPWYQDMDWRQLFAKEKIRVPTEDLKKYFSTRLSVFSEDIPITYPKIKSVSKPIQLTSLKIKFDIRIPSTVLIIKK